MGLWSPISSASPISPGHRHLKTGWGVHHRQYFTALGMWISEGKELYIIVLKMKDVQPALNTFLHRIMGKSSVLISDKAATAVTYLK